MIDLVVAICLIAGASFMLLAAVGIVRLPDLPTRMHASTKAGAMGAMFTMAGVAFYFTDSVVSARALAIVVFILITSPVAAHVIGRAGYFMGTSLWDGTVKDELRENYDPETHKLSSGYEGSPESVTPPPESDPPDDR
ncbi:monovalent cation/H(+) antiporter subunit G [Marinobacter orientalis]|uniref:Na+/H+ antiporter subunit G n=1 Tax=Marinobacter orientalis TaxID=1928859 RepID=A0A7Y0RE12_9GAMM|nr:monovalent cation/H(+) antiporter subunit G [Marinobacter orientalis]NMT64521.1 Na+/H+ antiporter subunit G [Marinobacter orientalis]TGX50524.1 Na+/H+ antiporter subunit G [Marinobacter orientalis]